MQTTENRFKILFHLCNQLGILSSQMEILATKIDDNAPQMEEALTYYENEIIKSLEP